MVIKAHRFKHIVAALALAVGFSSPVQAQTARLDELFDALRGADADESLRLEEQIRTEWSKSGSPAMDLLLKRGGDALEAGDPALAVEHLTALVDHAPDFAEAYNARATAYYRLGLIGPALDDLRQALVLNPRHFEAMFGFAVILDELGRTEDSLEVFHQIAEIGPNLPEVGDAIERLEQQLGGQSL